MSNMTLPTIKIKHATNGFAIINESDFDPKIHEAFSEAPVEPLVQTPIEPPVPVEQPAPAAAVVPADQPVQETPTEQPSPVVPWVTQS